LGSPIRGCPSFWAQFSRPEFNQYVENCSWTELGLFSLFFFFFLSDSESKVQSSKMKVQTTKWILQSLATNKSLRKCNWNINPLKNDSNVYLAWKNLHSLQIFR
jgi:hypothetical protein